MKRKYKHPAIQEAIFEAKFAGDGFDQATPGQFFERVKKVFPEKKVPEILEVRFGNPESTPFVHVPTMQAWKADSSALAQVGPGIVVANYLKYTSWEAFTPMIKEAVNVYIDLTKPKSIERIGVRYINSFLLPDNLKIMDYFNFSFQIPPASSNLEAFEFIIIHQPCKTTGITQMLSEDFKVKVRLATEALKAGEVGSRFILDIDCYGCFNQAPNVEKVIAISKEAHDLVEEIFENYITDNTRKIMGVFE